MSRKGTSMIKSKKYQVNNKTRVNQRKLTTNLDTAKQIRRNKM